MSRARSRGLFLVAAVAALVAAPPVAQAAYPAGGNGQIAFHRFTPTGVDVFLMNRDGSGQVNLTNGGQNFNAAVSPDGRRIAFKRRPSPAITTYDIFVMNLDGSGLVNLTNTPAYDESTPAWSPDGKLIAYNGDDEATLRDLWVMNANGTNPRNLTNTPAIQSNAPDWSPDGTRIVYERCTAQCEIVAINPDGSGFTTLSNNPASEYDPAYSPDGRTIVFSRIVGPRDVLMMMNPDGTNQRAVPGAASPAFSHANPVFSPNGREFLFTTYPGGNGEIITSGLDGFGQVNLTNSPAVRDERPSWQPIQRCGGRRVTIVGDSGPDKIKGTKRADVIATFGGRDKILGRGGNDRICAGAGKDRIAGGTGKKDRCYGGKGRDKGGKGCERGKL